VVQVQVQVQVQVRARVPVLAAQVAVLQAPHRHDASLSRGHYNTAMDSGGHATVLTIPVLTRRVLLCLRHVQFQLLSMFQPSVRSLASTSTPTNITSQSIYAFLCGFVCILPGAVALLSFHCCDFPCCTLLRLLVCL